ncbi:MAG: putative transrane protein, partial [Variovorax sp.]|nr:putative transrane protein [Variovorax sp.]
MDRRTGELKLADVDWARPWLAHCRDAGQAVALSAQHTSVAQALQATRRGIPAFVSHDHLPPDRAYEAHIFEAGTVPTRDNLHDFFNGLTWLAFPQTKRRLNALQAGEIQRTGVGAARGPLRDAL